MESSISSNHQMLLRSLFSPQLSSLRQSGTVPLPWTILLVTKHLKMIFANECNNLFCQKFPRLFQTLFHAGNKSRPIFTPGTPSYNRPWLAPCFTRCKYSTLSCKISLLPYLSHCLMSSSIIFGQNLIVKIIIKDYHCC